MSNRTVTIVVPIPEEILTSQATAFVIEQVSDLVATLDEDAPVTTGTPYYIITDEDVVSGTSRIMRELHINTGFNLTDRVEPIRKMVEAMHDHAFLPVGEGEYVWNGVVHADDAPEPGESLEDFAARKRGEVTARGFQFRLGNEAERLARIARQAATELSLNPVMTDGIMFQVHAKVLALTELPTDDEAASIIRREFERFNEHPHFTVTRG